MKSDTAAPAEPSGDRATNPVTAARKRSRALLAASLALPGLLAAGALALFWGLRTEAGSAWLLARVPGLQLESPSGALLGDFSARRLSYRSSSFNIDLQGLRWQGLTLAWERSPLLWGRIELQSLQADRVELGWSSSQEPSPPPQDLVLPLALSVPSLRVAELRLPALGATPLRDLQAGVWLGEQEGRQHRIELQGLQWDRLSLNGQARQQASGPMQLDLQARLRSGERWQSRLELHGPLAAPALQAQAEAAGQRLQLQAALRPFEAWPLASAEASAEGFDLAALHSALPQTAFSGRFSLGAKAWDQPARLQASLANAAAGRWDQQRLPLQSLQLDLQLRPDQAQQGLRALAGLQIRSLQAQLGSAAAPGGRLSASGTGLQLQASLSQLRTAALDARLPQLQLGGGLTLQAQPLVSGQPARLELQGRLAGDWQNEGKTRPVQLQLQARSEGSRIELQQALLQSGASQLALRGHVLPGSAQGGWQVSLSGSTHDFDPRLLWTGPARSPWALGQHSLDAALHAELRAGPGAWPLGEASLKLAPSLLAGVGLTGQLDYRASDKQAPALRAELEAGENRLQLATQELGGHRPRAQLELKAGRLAALSPLAALWAPQAQLEGSLQGRLELALDGPLKTGRLASQGQLNLQALQLRGLPGLEPVRLASGRLDWQLDSRADAALLLDLDLNQLSAQGSQLARVQAQLRGSWAQHELKLEARGLLPSPPWAAALAGADGPNLAGSLRLALSGQLPTSPWQAWQGQAPLDWRAQLGQLLLRPERNSQPAWLAASDLKLLLRLGTAGELQQAELAPGRLELAGAMLRWSQLQYQAPRLAGQAPQVLAELELEPLKVAPLLARWQPDFGWGGELVVGGRARVRSAPQVEIDVELGRAGGDLSVTEGRNTQALGLSDLRLSLQARDGVWHIAQGMAGSNLGVLAGALSSRTSPQALWPAADAPLEGVLQLDVANLGTWGAWVPAGWRLGGTFNAAVQLGGKVGAPEITGRARGNALQLRNPLLGVDMREGELALNLQGGTATLERFSARGGDGSLSAQGRAEFGAKPQLWLQLKAERFAFLGRVDRRVVASGQADLHLGDHAFTLGGRVGVDEALFDFSRADAPALDDDVQVLRASEAPVAAAAPRARGTPTKIDVQLALDLGRQLRVRGRGVDTRLRGELRLLHQGLSPQLSGTVRTFGGTYDAYGQKLEIEKGEISFNGSVDNPRLDVLAVRPNTDTRVGVTITGTALNPRVKLFSEPDMADTDKLSWLLLGRAPDGLGRADTALLQRAALALLSGEGESPSGKLIKNLGLDELSVSQDDSEARGTVLRLGKQLSQRLYLGYERGLNATAGSWQLIYRIARRFTLRAQAGEESAVDLIWQWRWN